MAFKNKETGKWTAQWYEIDIYGKRKQMKKRGFTTCREAKAYERQKKLQTKGNLDMTLVAFTECYFQDKENELKERTIRNKKYMMEQHVFPYFGHMKMNEITPQQIIQWQNKMYTLGFSDAYLRMIQNQLTALFTHAVKIYDLQNNPCKKVSRMGRSDNRSMTFWTLEEYRTFISQIEYGTKYYLIFEILFWTGMRVGELLALTKEDINFESNEIHITKTYYRSGGKDMVTTPKTEQSVRKVDIPNFLKEEIKEYVNRIYGLPENERLFPVGQEAVQHMMKHVITKAGVKQIRVHDLRHSHVAYLIHKGVEPLIIKERVGHKDIRITLNTYGHLYPSKQKTVANLLDEENKKCPGRVSSQDKPIVSDESLTINPEQVDYTKDSSINQSGMRGVID